MREPDICMVFDDYGNAFHCFDYEPDALEAEARTLRIHRGELTFVSVAPSPYVTSASGGSPFPTAVSASG